jgi:amino-acid N-acetyltransferase
VTTGLSFRAAAPGDLPQVVELLTSSNLPLAGVAEHLSGFLLAFRAGSIAGCAALERYGETALLRSVAVADGLRNAGLGRQLVDRLVEDARAAGQTSLLLLTTSAAAYFERFGFQTISRAEIPCPVQGSAELQGACPASATVMRLNLTKE